jgi:Flp pilus assembly pilin Flp
MARALWRSLWRDETAQDLAEYCLMTALLALIALGIFIHVSGGMQHIWGAAGDAMATAGSASQAGDSTASAPGGR